MRIHSEFSMQYLFNTSIPQEKLGAVNFWKIFPINRYNFCSVYFLEFLNNRMNINIPKFYFENSRLLYSAKIYAIIYKDFN